jgi:hypothetical protein
MDPRNKMLLGAFVGSIVLLVFTFSGLTSVVFPYSGFGFAVIVFVCGIIAGTIGGSHGDNDHGPRSVSAATFMGIFACVLTVALVLVRMISIDGIADIFLRGFPSTAYLSFAIGFLLPLVFLSAAIGGSVGESIGRRIN